MSIYGTPADSPVQLHSSSPSVLDGEDDAELVALITQVGQTTLNPGEDQRRAYTRTLGATVVPFKVEPQSQSAPPDFHTERAEQADCLHVHTPTLYPSPDEEGPSADAPPKCPPQKQVNRHRQRADVTKQPPHATKRLFSEEEENRPPRQDPEVNEKPTDGKRRRHIEGQPPPARVQHLVLSYTFRALGEERPPLHFHF